MDSLIAVALAASLVGVAGTVVAEPVELEIAGNTVLVQAAERSTRQTGSSGGGSYSTYHEERVTSGARVNGEGVDASVFVVNRTNGYRGPEGEVDRAENDVGVDVDGNAAGFVTDHTVRASLVHVRFDFGELARGEGRHVLLRHYGNTYGNGVALWRNDNANVGAGTIEDAYLNPNPTLGVIAFANAGAYANGGGYAGPYQASNALGAWLYNYAGDYTGTDASGTASLARCAGTQCQWDRVNANVCVVGARPPFFVTCLLS